MQPKYSVIIPIYNAESTLNRCLDSLLMEQYPDMELILVNDGSKDSSLKICRYYADQFNNVCVIDKENGGVSTARNAGLDAASGRFVLFVDSDDSAMPGFFSTIDRVYASSQGDLIQFSLRYEDGKQTWDRRYSPLNVSSRETMMPHVVNAICRKTLNGPVAKLYRRDLLEKHHIRFPVGASVAEDRVFNIHYSFYIQSYIVSEEVLYVINMENEQSLTRGRHADLQQQFDITDEYFYQALAKASIPESEKEQYRRAINFGDCRGIYHNAKLMIQDRERWLTRQHKLGLICDEINHRHMKYPKTRYCTLITLPVRLRLTPVIDAIAWKLTH